MKFKVEDTQIIPRKTVKYLRITLDTNGTYGNYILTVTLKAETSMAELCLLWENRVTKRVKCFVRSGTLFSFMVLLRIQFKDMEINKYQILLERVQRKILLRITSVCKTASRKALHAMAGVILIHLMPLESQRLFDRRAGMVIQCRRKKRTGDTKKVIQLSLHRMVWSSLV